MAEYNEDKLSALDIAKEAGKALILPQYQYMYNPGMFNVMRGRINTPQISRLITAPTSFVTKAIMNKAGWKIPDKLKQFGSDSKAIMNKAANYFGMDFDENFKTFGLKNESLRQSSRYQALLKERDELKGKVKFYDRGMSAKEYIKSMPANMRAMVMDPKYTNASKLKTAIELQGALRDNTIKRVGYAVGRGVTRTAMRGAMLLGKGGAYMAIGGLMMDAARLIGNPIGHAAVQAIDNTFSTLQGMMKPEVGGKLNMSYLSQGAYTDRQRALQAIGNSRVNARSVMGSEAMYAHQ